VCVCRERERRVIPKEFGHESLPLKYNTTVFKYKIHSVEVALHYLKYVYAKIKYFEYFLPFHQVGAK